LSKDLEPRIRSLSLQNQILLRDYVETKNSGQNNIRSDLVNLMEIHSGDITGIDYETIDTYVKLLRSDNSATTFNRRLGTIRNFFSYILSRGGTLNFDPERLRIFGILGKDIVNNRSATPLKLSELSRIRQMLQGDDLRHFTFELAFQYGCTLEELEESSRVYDRENRTFRFSKRNVQIDDSLYSLIEGNPQILLKQRRRSTFSDYFNLIAEKARDFGILGNRNLSWQDIKETREQFSLRCGECGDLFDNHTRDWMLIQYSFDPTGTKWFICKSCGERALSHA